MESILNFFYSVPAYIYEPLFMQRAAVALFLLSFITSGMGVLVVNRRYAFFSDAVSHSIFAGLALALIFNLPPQLATLIFGVFFGLAVVFLSRHSNLTNDTIIGLIFSAAIAFGLAVISRNPVASKGLGKFFLGDIITIDETQIILLLFLLLATVFFLIFCFNYLILESLSIPLARSRFPLKSRIYPYLFGMFLTLIVMVSVWSVGVLLVTAFLIAPAAIGRSLSSSVFKMFLLAVIFSVFSGQLGLYLSAQPSVNTATGATVVLILSFIFVIIFIFKKIKSLFF